MEHVFRQCYIGNRGAFARMSLWEPAVNRGFLLRGLSSYFGQLRGTDVFDYGIGAETLNYLDAPVDKGFDFIITNPPFNLAHAFISKAMTEARVGCAFLVRTSFLEGVTRYQSLWSRTPPSFVAPFAERVPMVKGRCDPEATTQASYCWVGWVKGWEPRRIMWIPPCRPQLERLGDYDTNWSITHA